MIPCQNLNFKNRFIDLGPEFYQEKQPDPVTDPYLVDYSPSVGQLIDLPEEGGDNFLANFSGNQPMEGARPLAMAYSGHQFGSYNPKLGDGRGLLLGEVSNKENISWDVHLKGAGPTRFARGFDGRATLQSSIREHLGSEALNGLGIPTTRSLAVIGIRELIYRQKPELAAILVRVADCHIRFGSFEFFHYTKQPKSVERLADFSIEHYHNDIYNEPDRYRIFFRRVLTLTAKLISKWQSVGFVHGVMNTDNMTITGTTFDYGPYGFMEDYLPSYVCNHSDHQGRYAFKNQPYIGLWNCSALGHALSSMISEEAQGEILQTYEEIFQNTLAELFRKKLGLEQEQSEDAALIQGLLDIMESEKLDYTNTFRNLTQALTNKITPELNSDIAKSWIVSFQERHTKEGLSVDKKVISMKQVNPKFILRNYMAQEAIDAAEESDFSMLETLIIILTKPFEEHKEYQNFANKSPAWAKDLEISCSS